MPVILTSIIDNLARNKLKIVEEYGEDAKEEVKKIISEICELKYEIQTNKPLKELTSKAQDAQIYNDFITKTATEEGPPTHFHTIWLLTECYMYRRINQTFEEMKSLRKYDIFSQQKEEAYNKALPLINQMGKHILSLVNDTSDQIKEEFINLLKLNLWGNKCDLSISLGQVAEHSTLFDTTSLDPNILSDHSEDIWKAICDKSSSLDIVDIVLDNTGYEVFTDLCLADYMISKNLAKSIRFYVKTIPWFISDVMTRDFYWILSALKQSENKDLQNLSARWKSYTDSEIWSIVESDFWTLPMDFSYMPQIDRKLYKKLAEAKAVFFKGDLNYRKLFRETNWDPTTPIDVGLEHFHPSKLCILRTIKADIVCGLEDGLAEKIEALDPKWMETGDWGLIQYSDKIVEID